MPTTTVTKKPTRRKAVARKPTIPKADVPFVSPLRDPETPRECWVLRSDSTEFTGPEYFYDGEIDVVAGTARVPLERTDWVKRLLFSGYQFAYERDKADFDTIAEA